VYHKMYFPFCILTQSNIIIYCLKVRRYYNNAEVVPPNDFINCSASEDSTVCDSLRGDARDADDHWGDGWLNSMTRWNSKNGPLGETKNREKMQTDKLYNLVTGQEPRNFMPARYNPLQTTTSMAVFGMRSPGVSGNLPYMYRQADLDSKDL
jgi:hypothetical protein